MTTVDVALQQFDLYPKPAATTRLAVRKHIIKPAGAAQYAGCVDGAPAAGCIDILEAGTMPVIPPTGPTIRNYSLTAVYEEASNGAFFVGELAKFVHVSPQRFSHVTVRGTGPSGLSVGVKGSAGEKLTLVAVDSKGVVHVTAVTIPASGSGDVMV